MIESNHYWIIDNKFIFKPCFNDLINDVYLSMISKYEHLIFSKYPNVNHYISNDQPEPKIREISRFNQMITLPESLKYLIFGDCFNQMITLPESLKHLTFGNNFDQQIILPSSFIVCFCIILYYFV